MFIQQEPIVVDVITQPSAAPDISIAVVLGMFELASVALLLAAIGGLLAGAVFIGIRRFRDASVASSDTSHVRLRI